MARCPAHVDRSPSLSVKLCGDGRILMHCFSGCDVVDITGALGLKLADLMPDRALGNRLRRVRSRMPVRDALIALDHDALIVALIGADFLQHKEIDEPTWVRLAQAVAKINAARAACSRLR